MSDIKRMDITEFRELGFLQEVNRRFLHPLGLALEVVLEPDGTEHLGGVWDYRDDPEWMIFVAQDIKEVLRKAGNVRLERRRHTVARRALFDSMSVVQSLKSTTFPSETFK